MTLSHYKSVNILFNIELLKQSLNRHLTNKWPFQCHLILCSLFHPESNRADPQV